MCVVLLCIHRCVCGHPVLCVCERLCVWLCVWCCSVVIRCYVSVSGDVCGVALCSPMCLWSSGVMYL